MTHFVALSGGNSINCETRITAGFGVTSAGERPFLKRALVACMITRLTKISVRPLFTLPRRIPSTRLLVVEMSTSSIGHTIPDRITALQSRIKELKMSKQDATSEVTKMKSLKDQLAKDKAAAAAAFSTETKNTSSELQLKTPKGTVDYKPEATLLRKKIFGTLESIFVKYGGSTIDTPVFELREILAGKYGEDSKLIYDLQDQGGELCSLRYDLTVSYGLA